MKSRKSEIEQRLQKRFDAEFLEVIDESAQHAGHAGNPGGAETHFHVRIHSPLLEGKPLLDQHRAINQALADLLSSGIHALKISIVGRQA